MKNKLVVIGWFTFVILTSLVFFPIALIIRVLTAPFDRRLALLQQFTCFWGSLYTWIMPAWKARVEGRDNIEKKETYMVISNHQSLLDILMLFTLFFHFKFVSKIEIFKIPLIGWNMYLNRYIRLKRGDKKSIAKMMKDAEQSLSEGNSILMFPEGTRSFDGKIKAFKPGAFIMAKKMKLPILPIVISGTNAALPKHDIDFHGRQAIRIRILEPVAYERFEDLSVDELSDLMRNKMIRVLDELDSMQDISGA
ncbi:MAG: 1-acyl-sn-glycerol-3-phosphate acyltransferase [Deltaproteobacteria bacterium]|nr:1-acyl-sn-glycerol-3-phosphate acyltransferase [Deltaproteobacteria bacterium]